MSRLRVLFVDDEVQVLEGLRNSLYRQRHEWDMAFAPGGAAALALLAAGSVDVVVSDMRMPGMDGAEFLQQVRQRYPGTARIVLSGHTDRAEVLRALPVAHQLLSKPCDVDELRATIQRVCRLQSLLHVGEVAEVIGRLNALPSSPGTYQQISQVARRRDASLDDITAIVEHDPALTAKVLQLINAPYFGLHRQETSIRAAIHYLGVDLIKALSLAGVFRAFPSAPFSIAAFQRHAFATAKLALRLSRGKAPADEVFAAALLHDIGELILADAFGGAFMEARREAREHGRPPHEIERERFGTSHAEAGAYLLGRWGLPLGVVEAVAFHHTPAVVAEGSRRVLVLLHIADRLTEGCAGSGADDPAPALLAECGITLPPDALHAMAEQELEAVDPA